MRWDADFQREQALDPRLLLLNSELPWRFMVANLIGGREPHPHHAGLALLPDLRDWAASTCSTGKARRSGLARRSHSSSATPRASGAGSSRRRSSSRRPSRPGGRLVRLPVIGAPEGEIVRARFDTPATEISFRLAWKAMHLPRGLVITAFRGLKPVAEQVLPLSANSPARIEIADPAGIDHLSLRITGRPVPDTAGVTGVVELESVRYRSRQELLDGLLHDLKCGAFDPDTAGNGSRFAWLPNHEYEVQLKTRVQVGHAERRRAGGRGPADHAVPHPGPAGAQRDRPGRQRNRALRGVQLPAAWDVPLPQRTRPPRLRRAVRHPAARRPSRSAERPARAQAAGRLGAMPPG